jgi:hypothetical protein
VSSCGVLVDEEAELSVGVGFNDTVKYRMGGRTNTKNPSNLKSNFPFNLKSATSRT